MQSNSSLEAILRRDRQIIFGGLIAIAILAWAYMVYLANQMSGTSHSSMDTGSEMTMSMGSMTMNGVTPWNSVDFLLTFVMWAIMMVAMMVPAAAPMVLIFAQMNRKKVLQEQPFVPSFVFLLGYLISWWGFAILATIAQWGLHQAALLSSMMGKVSPVVGGVVLIAAGIFQWTPYKDVCLQHCRSPLGFMMSHWRSGWKGTLGMGAHHGLYCLGCCWFLMGLMFVAGVMNLLWMAAIAAFILIEKVAPGNSGGNLLVKSAGFVMLIVGTVMIAQAFV